MSMLLAISNLRGIVGYAVKPGSFNTASFSQFINDVSSKTCTVPVLDIHGIPA